MKGASLPTNPDIRSPKSHPASSNPVWIMENTEATVYILFHDNSFSVTLEQADTAKQSAQRDTANNRAARIATIAMA